LFDALDPVPCRMETFSQQLLLFINKLKRSELRTSLEMTTETAKICRLLIAANFWDNSKVLIEQIKFFGEQMQNAKPSELVIGNTIRRILFIIRDEFAQRELEDQKLEESEERKNNQLIKTNPALARRGLTSSMREVGMFRFLEAEADDGKDQQNASTSSSPSSIQHALNTSGGHTSTLTTSGSLYSPRANITPTLNKIKSQIIEAINDWMGNIEEHYLNIAEQAIEHIHTNEVIMTFGLSGCVAAFLKEAGRKRKFKLFVAEAAPSYSGREMANNLSKEGIECTIISDASIFAIMSRVNKVIVGTHAVMADGGLLATSGINLVAHAAKVYKVPLIVCTCLYKLSPKFPSNLDSLQEYRSPNSVLNFESIIGDMENVTVINPLWDYIPPEFVSLFITNQNSYNPSYIYRLLAEFYDPRDDDFLSG
jgi:translation initiation factor eIF-2B subunit beta